MIFIEGVSNVGVLVTKAHGDPFDFRLGTMRGVADLRGSIG